MTRSTLQRTQLWERRGFGPAVVLLTAAAMMAWTWQTWPDVLIDFGVQLYVPWRLASGAVLYRDIAHYTGPISIYYCTAAFWLMGPSLRVLELANLPILAGILALIYTAAYRLAGKVSAIACGISFCVLFAFAHLTPAGNYNYVTPYEYEYTHALLLCGGCVWLAARMVQNRRTMTALQSGVLCGLVFLTRSEFFVAIVGAVALAFLLLAISTKLATTLRLLGIFIAGAMAPVVLSVLLLSLAMPMGTAIRGVLGMWPALLHGNVVALKFYQHSMGMDSPVQNLAAMVRWVAVYLVLAGAATAIAILPEWIGRRAGERAQPDEQHTTPAYRIAAMLASLAFGPVVVGICWRMVDWRNPFRPLPVVVIVILVMSLRKAMQRRLPATIRQQVVARAIFAMLSLLLLGKIFLYARIIHYGVWLAMPATMLLIAASFDGLAKVIKRMGGDRAVWLCAAAGVWGAVLVVHLVITGTEIRHLPYAIGQDGDQFFTNAQTPQGQIGQIVDNAVTAVQQVSGPQQTLACFPEGIMINYLARRKAPTGYVNFNPPDLRLFGESNMVAALQKTPPDFVLIVHKDTSEFGVRFFGVDYGQKLGAWIAANYHEVQLPIDLGAEPLRGNGFGIRLLVKNTPGHESDASRAGQ